MVQHSEDRRRLEKALEESQERVRIAAQVAKVGTFEWRISSNANIWTPELEALYGLPPGAFGGSYEAWAEHVHPEDRAMAKARVQEALRTGSFMAEWRTVWPDGSLRWLEARGWVERDAEGRPVRMIGVNLDITARKESQEALRRLDELRRLALESAQMGTLEMDLPTARVRWDERAQALFGLMEHEVSLSAAVERIVPEDRPSVYATLARITDPSSDGHYDMVYRTRSIEDGVRWVRSVGQVLFERERDGHPRRGRGQGPRRRAARLVGVVMDITEHEQTEAALREDSRRKDDFLAMLSHELRNPLAAIRSAGEVIQHCSEGLPVIERASAVLERQSAHMARLLDRLLDVSRIQRGELRTERATVDLVAILRDVLSDHAEQAQRKGVRLLDALEDRPLWLRGDPDRLTQIFANLLGNAVSFTEPGGQVTVEAQAEGSTAKVAVRDTGIGLAPDLRGRIFEAFQQGPQDLSRSIGGLGLGLSLARGLVELHGGSIEVHSEGVGLGSEFVVRLPLVRGEGPRDEGPHDEAVASAADGALHIVLVEDNVDSAEMMRQLLELSGHRVDVATRGAEGVALALERRPEVVLCDLGLPDGMTGFDVARQLRGDSRTRQVWLVALTGYGRPEDKARTLEAGFDDHLTKPVDFAMLERVLERAGTRGAR